MAFPRQASLNVFVVDFKSSVFPRKLTTLLSSCGVNDKDVQMHHVLTLDRFVLIVLVNTLEHLLQLSNKWDLGNLEQRLRLPVVIVRTNKRDDQG